jgi:hypothetical protein
MNCTRGLGPMLITAEDLKRALEANELFLVGDGARFQVLGHRLDTRARGAGTIGQLPQGKRSRTQAHLPQEWGHVRLFAPHRINIRLYAARIYKLVSESNGSASSWPPRREEEKKKLNLSPPSSSIRLVV